MALVLLLFPLGGSGFATFVSVAMVLPLCFKSMAVVLPLFQLGGSGPATFLSVAVVLPLFLLDGSGPATVSTWWQ